MCSLNTDFFYFCSKTYDFLLYNTKENVWSPVINESSQWIKIIAVKYVCLMVFIATFNNISVISWQSVLLMEETGETHRPVASH
jgi:hypothetical protein